MKIRQGFISNSSSTSFCVYGIYVDKDKIEQQLNPKLEQKRNCSCPDIDLTKPYCPECGQEVFQEREPWIIEEEIKDYIENELSLDFWKSESYDSYLVGKSIEGRTITKEFLTELKQVQKQLKEKFNLEPNFCGGEISN
jgi:hypothetical protein